MINTHPYFLWNGVSSEDYGIMVSEYPAIARPKERVSQITIPGRDGVLIPSIANYFNVSIDELFGYDNERSKKADALARQINDMIHQNNGKDVSMDECIALAREALIEFPGNEKLTLALASAMFTAGYVRHGEHHIEGDDLCGWR